MDSRSDTIHRADSLMQEVRRHLEQSSGCIRSIYGGSQHLPSELEGERGQRIWKVEYHLGEALEAARGYPSPVLQDSDYGTETEAIGEDDAVLDTPRYAH